MPRSGTRRWRGALLVGACGLFAAGAARAQVSLAGPARLVNVIEVSQHEDQVDITMVFNCSMRFVTSMPASEGRQVHIQLAPLPECGVSPLAQFASEILPLSGGANIVTAARLDSLSPGQITVTLDFQKTERFVLAQGVDPRGLRLRLIDHSRGRARILVGQSSEVASNFAINLESQPKPFAPADIELAHERLKAPAFVSEAVVDGEKWYRLRIGPVERRAEAERLLNEALQDYPRAWLAIGDDAVTSDLNATFAQVAPTPPVERIGSDAAIPPETLRSLMAQARAAMSERDYVTAIGLLTKLQRQPEFPDRARAQELLGLARERSGQLAHAKAEYEEYLRRYPHGEAAERVTFRLRILRAAEARARTGREATGEAEGWEVSGGVAQMARYDGSRLSNGALPPGTTTPPPAAQQITDNSFFNDVDLLARRRGETYDWLGRLSAGYDKSFTQDQASVPNPTRVSLASIEVLDRPLGLLARLGRQAQNADGILGSFDGLLVSWQFRPSWAIRTAVGYPVEQLILAPQTHERFETLALAFTPPGTHWDAALFAATQQFQGLRDRQAVGLEGRYLGSRASLVAVVDYDTAYHSLNTASLLGTLQLPARWSASFDAERRNSPVLQTRNALIGQPFTDLTQLEQIFTPAQIYQLALDRTPVTSNYSITASKPLGQRFQLTSIVTATETGTTPASGGVAAIPATGRLLTYQEQLYASNLWSTGDFNVLTLTHGQIQIGRIDSVSVNSRFPLGGAWRVGPRLTVDRLNSPSDGSQETTYLPSVLVDYQRTRSLFQLELGGLLGKREAFLQLQNGAFVQTQNTTRYYVSVSYRVNFAP
jgi:tetratricopeptide (TPR) repeat protein